VIAWPPSALICATVSCAAAAAKSATATRAPSRAKAGKRATDAAASAGHQRHLAFDDPGHLRPVR